MSPSSSDSVESRLSSGNTSPSASATATGIPISRRRPAKRRPPSADRRGADDKSDSPLVKASFIEHTPPSMESHEVLKKAFDQSNTSPKEIASDLGVSLSLVYKW